MDELIPVLVQLGPWGVVAAGAILAGGFIAKAFQKKKDKDDG